MPLLDIGISQPCSCFRNNILAFKSETHFGNKLVVGNDKGLELASPFSWKTFCIPVKRDKNYNFGRFEVWRGRLMIKAVATIEIASVARKNEGVNGYPNMLRVDFDSVRSTSPALESQSLNEDSKEVEEREKLRRMRISKANKGNTPWNKGRKHSPETLQRIKERTRLAMQDPKVKMKLVNLGHAHSKETRMKIGVGVRLGWERRREKLMVQETCHFEWQDLIAEAARRGLSGEEELQWDSYKTLSKKLEQEWLQSIEERKNMPRPKGSKRAPKSAEQKGKIAEAIAAKWADPEYRNRVCSGLAKFHGISERAERKPRRKTSGEGQTRKRTPMQKDDKDIVAKHESKIQVERVRKRSEALLYKDPLASSKLEMLKNIRAQRAAAMNKKGEAIYQAKLLIAEAEKAAEALEIASRNSPHVQTSLTESRMLIAKAIQFMQSIENDSDLSETEPAQHDEEETEANPRTPDIVNHGKVNGVHSLLSGSDIKANDFSFDIFVLPDLVNGTASNSHHNDQELHHTSTNSFLSAELNTTVSHPDSALAPADTKPNPNGSTELMEKPLVNGSGCHRESAEACKERAKTTKKWVRGRLVEVVEEN